MGEHELRKALLRIFDMTADRPDVRLVAHKSLFPEPRPQDGLDAAWAAVEALRAENERLREFLALRPSGHTGSMTERIPWFIHCGISHGENRPDCLVCAALREPKP